MPVTSASAATLMVDGAVTMRLDVFAREEAGSDTSLSTGGDTVTLSGSYTFTKSIQVQPQGTAARSAVVDNIVMGATSTFDVYIFTASGAQVAEDYYWRFQGV